MVRHGLRIVGGAPGVNLGPPTMLKPRDMRNDGNGGADDELFNAQTSNYIHSHLDVLKTVHPEGEPAAIRWIGRGTAWGRFVTSARPASWAASGFVNGQNYVLTAPIGTDAANDQWVDWVQTNHKRLVGLLEYPDEAFEE